MSISEDDIIQVNTGTYTVTPSTVTLPLGTTDGNSVVVCITTIGSASPSMSGFTRDHGTTVGNAKTYILRKSNIAAGETSWTTTHTTGQPTVWVAMEIQNIARLTPYECNASLPLANQSGTTMATNTTPKTTSYETLAVAIFGGQNTANSTVPTWSGMTNGFNEVTESSRTDGATATSMAVGVRRGDDLGTVQVSATASVSIAGNAVVAVYNAEGAHRVPNVDVMTGLEFGTAAGHKTGIATGGPPFDASTGTVNVVSTNPRSGSYCLELTGTAAAANVSWTTTGAISLYASPSGMLDYYQYVMRFSFLFPSALPASDVRIATIATATGNQGVEVTYRTAGQQVGVVVREDILGPGTEQLSASTLVADTWYSLDVWLDMFNKDRGQKYHAYWRLDDVDQTEAFCATSTPASGAQFSQVALGWTTATTATIRYDDIVCSKNPGHYPLGSIRIYPLKVDPAATPSVTNATAFSTMTANGTINSTFSTTTARDAVDDIPPTIGATADGFVQDAIGTTDYVELPVETRAAATNLQALRAVRWYFCGWAAGNPAVATIGFRGYDGAVETDLFPTANPSFTDSTTTPGWLCRMHRDLGVNTPYAWTQAELDALAARVGFSGDATPDIGIHALLAEVAMRDYYEQQVVESDGVLLYAYLDPDTGIPIAYNLVAPADGDAWSTYVISGVTVNRTASAGTNDLYIVGAEIRETVTFVSAGRT